MSDQPWPPQEGDVWDWAPDSLYIHRWRLLERLPDLPDKRTDKNRRSIAFRSEYIYTDCPTPEHSIGDIVRALMWDDPEENSKHWKFIDDSG